VFPAVGLAKDILFTGHLADEIFFITLTPVGKGCAPFCKENYGCKLQDCSKTVEKL